MSNEQEAITESNESQNQQGGVEEQSAKDSGEQNEVEQADSTERPEWLDPKFETPEQLANSYNQLQQKFHSRRDEIKAELVEEINEEASKEVPVTPADYKLEVQDEEGNLLEIPDDDHMLNWFRDKAHNMALSQDEFSDFVSEYMTMQATSGPDWNEESEVLGEHADRRLERVDAWANSVLSEEDYNVFAGIPASAGMVKFFESIMELNGQPKFNMVTATEFQDSITKEDLQSAQRDPKYWQNGGDPVHIAKVRAMAAQLARQRESNVN
tara:strand:- start:221 stop:1027 length:807 start_codon:yes stop_codon:yes gene_type:complete